MERQGVPAVDVSERGLYVHLCTDTPRNHVYVRLRISLSVCTYTHTHKDTQRDCEVWERSRS